MTVAELTRQYQATLEARRRLRTELATIVSADDLFADAAADVEQAEAAMISAWNVTQLEAIPTMGVR